MIRVDRATYEAFGGTLEDRVAAFFVALDAHRFTVNVPAPTEHPLVEVIARAGGMVAAEIEPAPAPEPEPEPPAPPAEPTLDEVTAQEEILIDADAVQAKAKYASLLLLQGATYAEKYAEAVAYLAADPATRDLDPLAFPYLFEEAAARGVPRETVATEVKANGDAWRPINARIEALRVAKKAEMRAAPTVEAKRAVRLAIVWP